MEDSRQHVRTPMVCKIKIIQEDASEVVVRTRDISDGGVFIVLDSETKLPVGSVVNGQIQGLVDDAPVLKMEVVRVEPTGVGLRFL